MIERVVVPKISEAEAIKIIEDNCIFSKWFPFCLLCDGWAHRGEPKAAIRHKASCICREAQTTLDYYTHLRIEQAKGR